MTYSEVYMLVMFGLHIVIKMYSVYGKSSEESIARFAANCYLRYHSVTGMMQELNWPTLKESRNESKLVMMYKIILAFKATSEVCWWKFS